MAGSDFIYIPVDVRWASPVYRLLAELAGRESQLTAGDSATPSVGVTSTERAGPELIRRMYDESQERHRRLMEFLAGCPEEWRYTSEIGAALGLSMAPGRWLAFSARLVGGRSTGMAGKLRGSRSGTATARRPGTRWKPELPRSSERSPHDIQPSVLVLGRG